jgi:hypothetical protein
VGLLRWIRGDGNSTSTSMMSAGLAEIAGVFQPTRHKQTEHIEESNRRRLDATNGTGVDLDRGVIVIRRPRAAMAEPSEPVSPATVGPEA